MFLLYGYLCPLFSKPVSRAVVTGMYSPKNFKLNVHCSIIISGFSFSLLCYVGGRFNRPQNNCVPERRCQLQSLTGSRNRKKRNCHFHQLAWHLQFQDHIAFAKNTTVLQSRLLYKSDMYNFPVLNLASICVRRPSFTSQNIAFQICFKM